jgi:hypothetical protein
LEAHVVQGVRRASTKVRLKPDTMEVRLKPDATKVRLKPDTTNLDDAAAFWADLKDDAGAHLDVRDDLVLGN